MEKIEIFIELDAIGIDLIAQELTKKGCIVDIRAEVDEGRQGFQLTIQSAQTKNEIYDLIGNLLGVEPDDDPYFEQWLKERAKKAMPQTYGDWEATNGRYIRLTGNSENKLPEYLELMHYTLADAVVEGRKLIRESGAESCLIQFCEANGLVIAEATLDKRDGINEFLT